MEIKLSVMRDTLTYQMNCRFETKVKMDGKVENKYRKSTGTYKFYHFLLVT